MAQNQTIKGTIVQFIPKHYEKVPSVQDLMGYYMKSEKELNDVTALGIVLLDEHEESHTFYAPVSFIINTLNKMKEPIQIRNRVEIAYASISGDTMIIQGIKKLPVFFERNQAHDQDEDAPAFKRMGTKRNEKAQAMVSFNPLLPVPNNINAQSDEASTVLNKDESKNLQDQKRDMDEVFRTTLKNSQFNDKADQMFQQAHQQSQDIIDSIFDDQFLDAIDDFNHIHSQDFRSVPDKNERNIDERKRKRPTINKMRF